MTHLESTPMMPLLFLYVALVSVLITYVVTRKLLTSNTSPKKGPGAHIIPLDGDDLDVPENIARQLSLMIRYVPSDRRAGAAKCRIVQIEERLMLGGAPLTNWVKHDEPVPEKISLDSQSIEQFSVLRLNKGAIKLPTAPEMQPKLESNAY